jgi:hypothetical protein
MDLSKASWSYSAKQKRLARRRRAGFRSKSLRHSIRLFVLSLTARYERLQITLQDVMVITLQRPIASEN